VLGELRAAHATAGVQFQVVVHHGRVALGGGASMGEESLMGPEVNFVFRLEKLAGSHGVSFCLSESAAGQLGGVLATTAVPGEHELKGFAAKQRVYTL